jgi:hypothetical protein
MENQSDIRLATKHTTQGDVPIKMMDLKEEDVFTLKEPDGTVVGKFKAAGSPYLNEDNVTTILCDPV